MMEEENKTDKSEEERSKIYLSPKELISLTFEIIEEKVWISMGLVSDTDGNLHRSKEDAKFLIDILLKMSEVMDQKFEKQEVLEIKNQLSNLQLNFVNQFKEQ
jgi:hypothetical protein